MTGETVRRTKQVYIRTYGCQMNVYDSERMVEALAPLGYRKTGGPGEADVVILNTCHIREKAAEKVYSELGRIVPLKARAAAEGRRMHLVVAGCVAQAEGAEVRRRRPEVDLVIGPQTVHRLPELLARAERDDHGHVVDTDFPVESKFDLLPERTTSGPTAFLTVQEGCDRFCTFCVVPYTRGAEFSRPVADVLAEARTLVAAGAREICLLGQNVNAYHGEGPEGREWSLARLLAELAGIENLLRLRYTTSHPANMSRDLVSAHGEIDRLMPYLHLPVQAGSDRVLKAMNRSHTRDDFRRVVDSLRSMRPDIALSSDFIVGFPGETVEDFEATIGLVEEVEFASAYSFRYSRRPGTPASIMGAQVAEPEKARRLAVLQELLSEQQRTFNRRFEKEVIPVLFEREGREAGQLAGRSPWMQAVHAVAGQDVFGTVAPVRIVHAGPHGLSGALASPPEAGA